MLILDFDPFPVLSTSRLVLRAVAESDQREMYALRTDGRVMRYIERPRPRSLEEALEFLRKMIAGTADNVSISWAITEKGRDRMIGSIGFWRIDKENYRAEIGYLLHPGYQGKGLMQEAIKAVIAYGFNDMKLHSIEANINPANKASEKLLEKTGFVREAFFRENFFFEGKFYDSAIYSLLAPVT